MSHAGLPERLRVIDSHTIGEPTRVVIDESLVAGLDLGGGSVRERRDRFRERYDHVRRALVGDPRGAVAMVGVILLPPVDPSCRFGAFYVNRVGYLDMCGHATIGLAVTLGHLGRIEPGSFRLETPAGVVGVVGVEGDTVSDPDSVYFGKRMKNGWKNSAPWVYDIDPAKMILEESAATQAK